MRVRALRIIAALLRKGIFPGLGAVALMAGDGCGSGCDTGGELHDAFAAAYQNPETFDAWLASHPRVITGGRVDCVNSGVATAKKMLKNEQEICDAAFVPEDDFWVACYNDADLLYGNMARVLNAMVTAASGATAFRNTATGASLIGWKHRNPAEFDALVGGQFRSGGAIDKFFHDALACDACD